MNCKDLMTCARDESCTRAVDAIRTNFLDRCKNGFITRAGHIGLLPLYVIASAIDAILGVGAALLSIVTLGTKKKLNEFAAYRLGCFDFLASNLYFCLLSILNPNLKKEEKKFSFGTSFILDLRNKARYCYRGLIQNGFAEPNVVKEQLCSRLLNLMFIPSYVVIKIINIAFGILLSPCAILLALSQKKDSDCSPSLRKKNCPFENIISTSTKNIRTPIRNVYIHLISAINPGAQFFDHEKHLSLDNPDMYLSY